MPTSGNGLLSSDRAFAPYGEMYDTFGNTNSNRLMFADLTQDVATGLYDTPNRELAYSNQGRWISPDPAGAGWNQYAYSTNPNSAVDPSGLWAIPGGAFGLAGGNTSGSAESIAGSVGWSPFGVYTTTVTVPTDSGSSGAQSGMNGPPGPTSQDQLCFCADDVTNGSAANAEATLPGLGPGVQPQLP